MNTRIYRPADSAEWQRMRTALWPDQTAEDMEDWLGRSNALVLVAERESGSGLCGFAEVGTRPWVEGCATRPVAYLEGWWVDGDVRRSGVGAALMRAVESWARERGLTEIASDTHPDNVVSQQAHQRLGFRIVDRAVVMAKTLAAPEERPHSTERIEPVIRRLGREEAPKAVELAEQFKSRAVSPEQVSAALADDRLVLMTAEVDGRAVGFALAHALPRFDGRPEKLFLYEIEVRASHRRQGIGRALMEALAAFARKRDHAEVFWITQRSNTAATALYRACGAHAPESDDVVFEWPVA